MKKIALIMLAIISFSGCSALNVAQINYDVVLSKVERSPAPTAGVTEKPSGYSDDQIEANFIFTPTSIEMNIINKSNETIKLIWDDSAFIDRDGLSTKVMHEGIKYNDLNNSILPSIIPRNGKINDIVIPTDIVAWQGGYYSSYGSNPGYGKNLGMLPYQKSYGGMTGEPMKTTIDEAQNNFLKEMQGYIGSKIGLILSFQSPNSKYEYTFWFEVKKARLFPENK
jgi:hypothetical protein